MNRLEAALVMLLAELAQQRQAVALVGGLAVSARAEPRLTRDLDLAVTVTGPRSRSGAGRMARDVATVSG